MLYTQKQNDWVEIMKRDQRGETTECDPGYGASFKEWKAENETLLPRWNAEERVQQFTQFLCEKTREKKDELIEQNWPNSEKKNELMALSKKDQLFLVSTDDGQTFDKVMSLTEVKENNPISLRFLSSSLISTSLDGQDILEEQGLVHVVNNLKESGLLVKSAVIEKNTIKIVAILPQSPDEQEINVPLDVEATEPFDYQFRTESGVQHVLASELPEHVGTLKKDKSLIAPSKESTNISFVDSQNEDLNLELKKQVMEAMIAGSATVYAVNKSNERTFIDNEALSRAQISAEKTRISMKSTLVPSGGGSMGSNVIAAKAAMAARFARQQKEEQQQEKLHEERVRKYLEEQKNALEKKQEIQMKTKKRYQEASVKRRRAAVIGAAATLTGLTSAVTGLPILLQLITK